MSFKVCNIRLTKEHLQLDQKRLNEFLETVDVKLTSSNFVTTNSIDYWSVLVFYEPKFGLQESKGTIGEEAIPEQKDLYLALKNWRSKKAKELALSHFKICYNSELIALASNKPKTVIELEKIKGFGTIKIKKFGEEILEVVNSF